MSDDSLNTSANRSAVDRIAHVSLNLDRLDYSRASTVIGTNGDGTTELLDAVEARALAENWITVRATGTDGFVDRLTTDQMNQELKSLRSSRRSDASEVVGLRGYINAITAAAPNRGLLFLIDGIDVSSIDDLENFISDFQHAIQEQLNVAVVMSIDPATFSELIVKSSGVLAALNRAHRVEPGH